MAENTDRKKTTLSPVAIIDSAQDKEKLLVQQAKQGDIDAFEQLIQGYQKPVFNFALRLCNNRLHAQDISQEAFIKVFKSLASFRGDSSFATWLYKIVRRTFYDDLKTSYYKNDARHRSIDDENFTSAITEDIVDETILQNIVEQALAKLPLKLRMSLVMYELQGFSYKEISVIEQTNEGTIKSRINKARKKLAQDAYLKKVWQD